MILTGIGDEAASAIDGQIAATQELGWRYIEARAVEVPGYAKANLHEIPDAAFDLAVKKLEAAGGGVYCFGSAIIDWSKKLPDPAEDTHPERQAPRPRVKGIK